jgi:hypothetical protein
MRCTRLGLRVKASLAVVLNALYGGLHRCAALVELRQRFGFDGVSCSASRQRRGRYSASKR